MAYENLCMYCFEDMQGQTTCPHCGRDSRAAVPQVQLLPGSLVYRDRFLIGRALGQDATGIVYSAFDTKKGNRLRIREYLPRDCAERLNDGAVVPVAGMEDSFEVGLRKLRASVEGVEDPRKRHFFFEENGTGYIAQRKGASPAPEPREDDDEDEPNGSRRVLMFAGIAVAVLVVAAILLITVFNGAITTRRDITQSPTLNPEQIWIPAATPTATPYVAPTFAALVDPELSWMEYTYEGDVEEEYQQAQRAAATPTPRLTPAPTPTGGRSSGYRLINGDSSATDIRALQRRLAELGWLDEGDVTGKYDAATRQAIRDFQSYINQRYDPDQRLSVDGSAGPKTLQWLYETAAERPTPTPAPRVTPRTDAQTVNERSAADQVRDMQRKLIALGLLPEGSDDGSFGATTATAVRRFQQRVNQLSGYDVLEVTGHLDPQSAAFLDYYAEEWASLRRATAAPTATPAPTAVPTPTPTTRPVESFDGTINANSSAQAIREVQQLLIDIGMLNPGSADGRYGTGTISAVADFQQWVNMQRQEQTLPVNGEVDQMTLAYLQYCVDHGMRPYGTAQPQVTPTPAPVATPEPEPQTPEGDVVDEGNEEISVGPDSDPESIRYVQQMLSAVGAMDESGVDGIYGGGTRRAVERFQQWVNSVQGSDILAVTGQVDNATRLALEYAYDHDLKLEAAPTPELTEAPTPEPTPEPAPEPTPEPTEVPVPEDEVGEETGEISVGADSDPESIFYVQQMLNAVGVLEAEGISGVYDDATVGAVRRFQQWVNSAQGDGTLPITGQVDDRTRQALEYAFDHNLTLNQPTPESEAEQGVGAVGDISIAFGDTLAGDDVIVVPDGEFAVKWRAEGDVEGYYVLVLDGSGQTIVSRETGGDTSFTVNTRQMNPGEVYTLRLGVLPARGGQGDVIWRAVRFALPAQATPEPEPEPVVGSVSAPEISVNDMAAGDEPVVVEDDALRLSWAAEGDVAGYYVRITDAAGNDISEPQRTTQTGATLRAENMEADMVYTLTVGVVPVNGGESDMQISRARFVRPARQTPEPTPRPVVANIGKPVINVGGSAYQKDGVPYMTDDSIIISWTADGDVKSYAVFVENQAGERQELGTTTDTSRTVSASSLPAGVYTVYVGALPEGGGIDDVQWSSTRFAIPSPEGDASGSGPEGGSGGSNAPASAVSGSSDSDTIQQLQMRLYSLGLLSTDGLTPGVLDEKTLRAVAEFQQRMNDQYDAGLDVLDPSDLTSVIDAATVRALFAE